MVRHQDEHAIVPPSCRGFRAHDHCSVELRGRWAALVLAGCRRAGQRAAALHAQFVVPVCRYGRACSVLARRQGGSIEQTGTGRPQTLQQEDHGRSGDRRAIAVCSKQSEQAFGNCGELAPVQQDLHSALFDGANGRGRRRCVLVPCRRRSSELVGGAVHLSLWRRARTDNMEEQ